MQHNWWHGIAICFVADTLDRHCGQKLWTNTLLQTLWTYTLGQICAYSIHRLQCTASWRLVPQRSTGKVTHRVDRTAHTCCQQQVVKVCLGDDLRTGHQMWCEQHHHTTLHPAYRSGTNLYRLCQCPHLIQQSGLVKRSSCCDSSPPSTAA